MAKVDSKPDFILWTGDNAPHWDGGPGFNYIYSDISNITRMVQKFFPGVPILPCIGNHDTYPSNQYPANAPSFYDHYLNNASWDQVLDEQAQKTFSVAGYYSWMSPDSVQVLVLNTNIYYRPNRRISDKEADPGGQLAWLEEQLKTARRRGYKVLLAAHIAPGFFERHPDHTFLYPRYNDALIHLLVEHGDVVMGQLFGHSHTDSFRLVSSIKDGELHVAAAALVAPSLTPWVPEAGTNPSVRRFTYSSAALLDYTQHALNLTASNAIYTARWAPLYDSRVTYNLANLTAASLAELFGRLMRERHLFDDYYRFNTAGHVTAPCDSACRRRHLCSMSHLTEVQMASCLNTAGAMHAILAGDVPRHGDPATPTAFGDDLTPGQLRHEFDLMLVVALVSSSLVVLVALVVFAFICRRRVLVLKQATDPTAARYETMT